MILCIDPGHGGYDPGACANGLEEKTINLFVAQHLRDLLVNAGIEVVMTRDSDVCPAGDTTNVTEDLEARCAISDNAGADYFLSIHHNAGGGCGAESYVIPGGQGNAVAPGLVDAAAITYGYHGEKCKDGGPNGANLYVVKHTQAHAILLELAYVDSSDAQKIKDHIAEVAPNLANYLVKILGGTVKVNAPIPPAPVSVVTPIAPVDLTNYVTHDQLKAAIPIVDMSKYVTTEQMQAAVSSGVTAGIAAGMAQKLAKINADLS